MNGDVNYFQRKFVNEVRRCDELERKLRYIETEVRKDGVPIMDPDRLAELPRAPNPRAIIDLEVRFLFLGKRKKKGDEGPIVKLHFPATGAS